MVVQNRYFGTWNYRHPELIVQREITGVGHGDPLENEIQHFSTATTDGDCIVNTTTIRVLCLKFRRSIYAPTPHEIHFQKL